MGFLTRIGKAFAYVAAYFILYDSVVGIPVNPLNPDATLVEKSQGGIGGIFDASSGMEPHSIVPREVATSYYRNKNEDEMELAEELQLGKKSYVAKRQEAPTTSPPPTQESENDEKEGNSTMADFGRRMKFG